MVRVHTASYIYTAHLIHILCKLHACMHAHIYCINVRMHPSNAYTPVV